MTLLVSLGALIFTALVVLWIVRAPEFPCTSWDLTGSSLPLALRRKERRKCGDRDARFISREPIERDWKRRRSSKAGQNAEAAS